MKNKPHSFQEGMKTGWGIVVLSLSLTLSPFPLLFQHTQELILIDLTLERQQA